MDPKQKQNQKWDRRGIIEAHKLAVEHLVSTFE
jgi:hypothetical protein